SIMRGKTRDTPARASGHTQPRKYTSQVLTRAWATMTTTLGMARRSRVGVMGASTSWRVRPATGLSVVVRGDWDIGRHPFAGTGGTHTAWRIALNVAQQCLRAPPAWAPPIAGRRSPWVLSLCGRSKHDCINNT